MSVTLLDTNVLLDVVTDDPNWAHWAIAIDDVIYAELLVRFSGLEALDAVVTEAGVALVPIPLRPYSPRRS